MRLSSVTDGTACAQDVRKHRRAGLRRRRLMLTWRRLAASVVFPAERIALAMARSGTRSKNNPTLPLTTVFVESER